MRTLPEPLRSSPRPRPRGHGSLAWVYIAVAVLVAWAAQCGYLAAHYLRAEVGNGPPTGGLSVFGALLLVVAVRVAYCGWRHHTILTRGQGAVGVVRAIRPHDRGRWRFVIEIDVAAPLQITGKVVVRRRVLERLGGGRLPNPGDTAYVVYDPARPKRFALWSFESSDC